MRFIVAIPFVLLLIFLVVGGLSRRVRIDSCCSTNCDPSLDLRLREVEGERELAKPPAPPPAPLG